MVAEAAGGLVRVELDPTGRVRDVVLGRGTGSLPRRGLTAALVAAFQQAQDEARRLAEVDGSTAGLVRAGAPLGLGAASRESPGTGLAAVQHAVGIAERSGRPDDLGVACLHLAELLTGPLDSVEEGVLVARRGAARLASLDAGHAYQVRLLTVAAKGLFRVGQWSEAESVVGAAMRPHLSGADAVELLLVRCQLRVGFGHVEAAHRDLDAVAIGLADGGAGDALPMLAMRAGLAIWQARHAEARAVVQRGLSAARSDDLVLLGLLAWHGLRAEAQAHVCGEHTDAAAIRRLTSVVRRIDEAADAGGAQVRAILEGYSQLSAAELDRIGDRHDPEPWTHAAQIWDRCRQPYPAAYARLRQAEAMLLCRTRKAAATAALRQAYATATTMRARPFATEIVGVARRFRVALTHDADTVSSASNGPDERNKLGVLTRREREVLAALSDGLTNREIGERLFISQRTVGVHVGHIFDKLQVRTRVQASRMLVTATRDDAA